LGYKTIVGLEIHSELMTKSKVFCDCTTEFGGEVNTHCCPICLGLPGTLPVINKSVVEYGIKAGLAFNCHISEMTKMDRKNYFYPDLVKGYQISQYDMPLCERGYVEINSTNGIKKVNIRRIHMEEDTGKSIHSEDGDSLLDYNRSGVPLIEIVTEPDMNSSDEAKEFLDKLKAILQYIEISDCKMEEGSLRCDVNINMANEFTGKRSRITEIKNLNSFKAVVKAIEYEEKRHIQLLEAGSDTERETRRWDDIQNETISMRSKENVSDYRYFPEPDIVEIDIDNSWIDEIRKTLPELPHIKKERFINEYDLPEYDAEILTSSKAISDFYEETVRYAKDPKQVSNWVMGDMLRRLKDEDKEIEELRFTSEDLANLIKLINEGKINNNIGKKVFKIMFEEGKDPYNIVKDEGLIQLSDENELREIIEKVLGNNQQSVEDYKNGKERAFGFLVGQVMKVTKGKANPQIVNSLILEILKK